jgi:biotin synthase
MMRSPFLRSIDQASRRGRAVGSELAAAILRAAPENLPDLCAVASRLRRRYFGNRLHHCSIINAKSGACAEDCAFCAQSARHRARADIYGLRSNAAIRRARQDVADLPVGRFGVVTSGGTLAPALVRRLCDMLRRAPQKGPSWCASLGGLTCAQLVELKQAGLRRYHHNLETAASFFPQICTTHFYADRLATVRAAKKAGLEICSGGILGMGESAAQRVEFALALAREDVNAIPLNFLVAIPGTPLAHQPPLAPLDILKIIVMFRMTNPRAEIKVCAGRNHLRDLQALVFYAGATGIMIGRLLTIAGRDVAQDVRMLRDLEFETGNAASPSRRAGSAE